MIETKVIESLVKEKIEGSDIFIVEIKIDTKNTITIFLDSPTGVSIDTCVSISRHVEHSLDREVEDFALEVSSAGIGLPFKVIQQYHKAVGKTVEILFADGKKIQGILNEVKETEISVTFSVKEKPEGAKRPKMVEKISWIAFDDIKTIKEIITF